MLQPACELREFKRAEGATPDQLRVLRSRKRSREEETEEVKWRMIYRILFPGDIIPSPCKPFLPLFVPICLLLFRYLSFSLETAELSADYAQTTMIIRSKRQPNL